MVALWMMIVILSLFSAMAGALIALRLQYRILEEGRQERDAWREAQEGRQRTWEVRQAKRNLEVEKQLSSQFKDLRKEWQGWQQAWQEQAEQDQQTWHIRVALEQEVARLPHIEDVELPLKLHTHTSHQQPDRWQAPTLYQADLRGRDLSHRYMHQADLREAQLTSADLYMTDLTNANLAGANLEGANLAGANLCGANLRGANLRKTNLLVADLHNAILQGTTLLEARGLTLPQLHAAIYDETTSLDSAIHAALTHISDGQIALEELSQTSSESQPEAVSEPVESEVTLSMPILSKMDQSQTSISATVMSTQREDAQEPEQSAPTEATATASLLDTGQTLADKFGTQDKQQNEETQRLYTDTEEVPSSKIIQLPTHSSKIDGRSATPKASRKTKGDRQISAMARKSQ